MPSQCGWVSSSMLNRCSHRWVRRQIIIVVVRWKGQCKGGVLPPMERNSYHQVSSRASAYTKVSTVEIDACEALHECLAWHLTCDADMCRGRHQQGRRCQRARPATTWEDLPRKALTPASILSCSYLSMVYMFQFNETAHSTVQSLQSLLYTT